MDKAVIIEQLKKDEGFSPVSFWDFNSGLGAMVRKHPLAPVCLSQRKRQR